ncbi:MAG: hypothetical protein HC888_13075, partial [Candidatus Competibacteraceae bacterium]|nr:hypothetical protein [Candidatus Competibacteraceae bacterium]
MRPEIETPAVEMEPAQPSAFEELKPVVPGQQRPTVQEGTTFSEVAPAIPDMPEEYLAGLEEAIQPHLDVVLIESLQGLVFVDSEQKVVGEGIVGFEGARADEALPLLNDPGFQQITGKYLGQPVTLRSLNELNREVVAYYTANDYPVVDVIIPEHDITGGVVQLVVLEGRLGMVDVEGNRWFANGLLTSQIRTESNQVLRAKKLLQDLS